MSGSGSSRDRIAHGGYAWRIKGGMFAIEPVAWILKLNGWGEGFGKIPPQIIEK